jgi:Asp-tRNA(Asn)/Glu-tRNA(Gln) amidotransferase A subunit family amidase
MSDAPELTSATDLVARLRSRELGSEELLDLQLERIGRLDGELNAVVALDVEGAREAARAADAAPAGDRGPLHGLPMTIKDSYEVVGMPATCGFPHLAEHRPERDADAVARLRAAGAIPFGKTNLPLAAADHQSYNPIHGRTGNPWDATRTPGGSSGGAAAAVAAGFTPLELGSDIGGSIRCPAHFCASTATSRATGSSRCAATSRRCPVSCSRRRSASPGRSRAAPPISSSRWTSSPRRRRARAVTSASRTSAWRCGRTGAS